MLRQSMFLSLMTAPIDTDRLMEITKPFLLRAHQLRIAIWVGCADAATRAGAVGIYFGTYTGNLCLASDHLGYFSYQSFLKDPFVGTTQ